MVRTYKRKRPAIDKETMIEAVLAVKKGKMKIKHAAEIFGVSRPTLHGWLKNTTEDQAETNEVTVHGHGRTTILNAEAEETLMGYLTHCNDMYFGLSAKEVRGLAYDFARKLELPVPTSWEKARMAGEDWLTAFLKRHPALSLKKPEATSLARATSFNQTNVQASFSNLKIVLDRHLLPLQRIWNMDETGITTV